MTESVLQLVAEKAAAHGQPHEKAASAACSAGILEEYFAWKARTQAKLLSLGRGSKEWWKLSRSLLGGKESVCSVPPLKLDKDTWAMTAGSKANAFAKHFSGKFAEPVLSPNAYTALDDEVDPQTELKIPEEPVCEGLLSDLKKNSGTGPDDIPAQFLQRFSKELARPVHMLGVRMLKEGVWPDIWRGHRLVHLHKKKSRHAVNNYRAIHLTAHLSKVLERFISLCAEPYVVEKCLYGPNQWAYQRRKGARDALAYLTVKWLIAISSKKKVVLYNADVASAFDRVERDRLIRKIRAKGLHEKLVAPFASWLKKRRARIVVGGVASNELDLQDMIFQGTVIGP